MIRYALCCASGHEFEAWFSSSSAYDAQAASGEVLCPACGSTDVSKALMAPNVATGAGRKGSEPSQQEAVEMVRKFREHVEKTSDNVGPRFAEEARKIHYKEAEPRGIIGSATDSEAKALREEGVEFHPLPPLPEDHN